MTNTTFATAYYIAVHQRIAACIRKDIFFESVSLLFPFDENRQIFRPRTMKQLEAPSLCLYLHPVQAGGTDIGLWRGGGLLNSVKAFGDASLKVEQ